MKYITIELTDEQYQQLLRYRPAPLASKSEESYIKHVLLSYVTSRKHILSSAGYKRAATLNNRRKLNEKQAALQYFENKKTNLKSKSNDN